MENITTTQRNKMAATYGLLLGVIYMVMVTVGYISVGNMMAYSAANLLAFIFFFVILGIFAGRIRKTDGGFIEFKDVFAAIIVMIFISCLISYVYHLVYMKYIDPSFSDKLKNTTIQFMEKNKLSDEQIEKSISKFDKDAAAVKSANIGQMLLSYFEIVILNCVFGLIVALIVRKKRPIFDN